MEKELNLPLDNVSVDFKATEEVKEEKRQLIGDNSISKAALISYLMS
ncbi:MAG: hypothetical protein H7X94_04795 [Vallitaleaceae bacterium]|nr:hypothetical protein [Vallitaleaceae bacterium]